MTTFPHEYALYGLTLRSNRPLPGMVAAVATTNVVEIDFAGHAEETDDGSDEGDEATAPFWSNGFETLWHLDARHWLLRYRAATMPGYRWTLRYAGGERVTVRWHAEAVLDDMPAVLQGPGIAAALHLRGIPLLHACVVDVEGGAILVLGAPGAGKSTTAAALVRSGCRLVSDDLAAMALEPEGTFVQPGYPRLRLYSDSAAAAGWDAAALPRVFTAEALGDKRFVDLAADGFNAERMRVRAIYMLQPRRAGGGAPVVRAIERQTAWPLLAQNIYSMRFLDATRRLRAVRDCATIASAVPVRSVEASDDLRELPRLVSAITRDALAVSG